MRYEWRYYYAQTDKGRRQYFKKDTRKLTDKLKEHSSKEECQRGKQGKHMDKKEANIDVRDRAKSVNKTKTGHNKRNEIVKEQVRSFCKGTSGSNWIHLNTTLTIF
jgi:hypothetical protein